MVHTLVRRGPSSSDNYCVLKFFWFSVLDMLLVYSSYGVCTLYHFSMLFNCFWVCFLSIGRVFFCFEVDKTIKVNLYKL